VLECVDMAGHINRTGSVIAITSHPDSELRTRAHVVLDMGVIVEPCPLGLTPSASIAAMGAIADALTLVLMEQKGVTREAYGVRHHGGYLGRKARLDNV
jgi:arabinose-5-phosphate isomerase